MGEKRSHHRDFYHCPECDLVFVGDDELIEPHDEVERYMMHNNDSEDEGYRRFLSRLFDQLEPRLEPGGKGLGFGCGEEAVLVSMFEDAGFEMDKYDLYFHYDPSVFANTYDFVACSETVEHFRQPRVEFERFNQVLRAGGHLGVMTAMLSDWSKFEDWHYHFDITHICFYSTDTMRWIAERYLWECDFPRENVVIFRQTG